VNLIGKRAPGLLINPMQINSQEDQSITVS
jgi:hypothetical protein